eukprot:403356790
MESNTCAVMKLNYEDVYKREQEVLAKESDEDFTFRILQRDDFKRGHLQTLAQLTQVGNPTQQDYEARFDDMFPKYTDHYRIVVIVDKKKDKIVGSGTVFIEKKFLRECGICGHIEDIAVDSTYRGKKLGIRLIKMLKEISQLHHCYKIVLDCSDANVPFYEANGFKIKERCMAIYPEYPKL